MLQSCCTLFECIGAPHSPIGLLAGPPQCGGSYSNGQRCPSVCLFCGHTRISPKLSKIDVWLLGNSNRNPGFPIQNLPSDSRSEVRFRHFGCFRVRPFRQKWAGWASECSEWISGNSHQSAPHWAPWRASDRHVP